MLRQIYPAVVFLLELVMIYAVASFGYQTGATVAAGLFLALVFSGAAIALWAVWAAPRSSRRLPQPYLAFFRGALLLLSAVLLYRAGRETFAAVVTVLAVATQGLSYRYEKESRH